MTEQIFTAVWHYAYCRWFDHNEAGHRRRAAAWGALADAIIRLWDKKKATP